MAYQTSQGLASLGRNGDSMLVHMNPTEVAGLQGLAMAQGGSLTINPHTGLPEAFKLGGFFKSLLPTLAGFAASGMSGGAMSPMLAGILAGSATGAVTSKDPLMGAITGGLGGYGGANLFSAANAFTPAISGTVSGTTGQVGGANLIGKGVSGATSANALPSGFNQAVAQSGSTMDQALLDPLVNQQMQQFGGAATGGINFKSIGTNLGGTNLGAGSQGINNLASYAKPLTNAAENSIGIGGAPANALSQAYKNVAADPIGFIGQNKMAVGMPIGGALLGGLEPSDIYGEPINMDEAKKKQAYDPNATLNLSGDTGLRLYATGGTIQSGGIRDLYGTPDNQPTISPGLSGFGLGRLNNLAGEQAMTQAQTLGYAMGGPVSFADGGDSNKEDALGLPSLSPDVSMGPNVGADNSAMAQSAMQPMQGSTSTTQVQMPDQSNDSLIAKVAANLKADPNYQPENPIEASIVKQLKGTDPMQQGQPSLQGLGSLGPSQPMAPSFNPSQSMAPSFNPSVAMGPTYFAGINAPQGYADGGDVVAGEKGMNLDELPSLDLNTGKPSENSSGIGFGNSFGTTGKDSPLHKYFGLVVRPTHTAQGVHKEILGRFIDVPEGVSTHTAQGVHKGLLGSGMARGGYLDGAGDGMSDSIPATIEGKQPARLADGEFVIPADVVSHIGNGSSKAGSKRLYAMLDKVRHARTGNKKQGKEIKAEKYLPA